jgi:MSHA biogenesis protein MshJ
MEIRGGYLSTLRYLEELEDLPWRFFWKSLNYEVLEYPEARVVLTVETLSLREGWIGV